MTGNLLCTSSSASFLLVFLHRLSCNSCATAKSADRQIIETLSSSVFTRLLGLFFWSGPNCLIADTMEHRSQNIRNFTGPHANSSVAMHVSSDTCDNVWRFSYCELQLLCSDPMVLWFSMLRWCSLKHSSNVVSLPSCVQWNLLQTVLHVDCTGLCALSLVTDASSPCLYSVMM